MYIITIYYIRAITNCYCFEFLFYKYFKCRYDQKTWAYKHLYFYNLGLKFNFAQRDT